MVGGVGVGVDLGAWMGVTTARSIGRCSNAVFQAAGATHTVDGDSSAFFLFEGADDVAARSRLS